MGRGLQARRRVVASDAGDVYVPPEYEPGVYANGISIWSTPFEFVLDFGVQLRGEPESAPVVEIQLVARVRIPVGLAFDVLQTLNVRMGEYEGVWGEIVRPTRREREGGEDA